MQTFLVEHNVLFALICGLLAVAYGAYLTRWVLQQSPGNERMREIQAAIQEGASAYLNRQYRTVGVVAVVVAALLLIAGIWSDDLGWKVALGFIIGAVLSALAGYVGMNTAVRANARVAEAGRTGLSEAFDVAFKGGTVTGILVVGLGLLGVAGYYGALRLGDVSETAAVHALVGPLLRRLADLGLRAPRRRHLHEGRRRRRRPRRQDRGGHPRGRSAQPGRDRRQRGRQRRRRRRHGGRPLRDLRRDARGRHAARAAGGLGQAPGSPSRSCWAASRSSPRSSARSSCKVGSGGSVMGALYKGVVITASISALVFIPVMHWMVDEIRVPHDSWGRLYLCALVGLVITALLMVITEYYTGTQLGAGQAHLGGLDDRPRDQHHRGAGQVDGGHGGSRARDRHRHPRRVQARRHHGHRPGRRRDALAGRHDRGARRLRADHRQRGRHRRDGGHARVGARHHRSARCGRQHHEGRHEGLRDRLGRPRRPRALRLLLARAGHQGRGSGQDGQRRLLDREPVGARRAPDRRDHAVPVRLARDGGGRPRRRRGRTGGAPPVPRDPGDHGGHRAGPSTRSASTSSRAARSRRCGSRR